MRLKFVKFGALQRIGADMVDELSEEANGPIEYNPTEQTITVGEDIIPIAGNIKRMRAVRPKCDVCGQDFDDVQGLGGHRKHVHKIPGKRT